MKLKIAVCDDAAEQKDALCAAVSGWAADREHEVVLRAFDSAEAFLFHYETERDFDALLLDVDVINMSLGSSGIELARRLRGEKCRAEILFITSHAEFIGEGYEVDALHYLMKPVAEEKLRAVLDRAAERLAVEPPYLVIAAEGETLKLYEREIVSVEAFLHGDAAEAQAVIDSDDEADADFDRIKRALIQAIRTDPAAGDYAIDVLMIAKYLERIGDHAVNIGKWILFAVNGQL